MGTTKNSTLAGIIAAGLSVAVMMGGFMVVLVTTITPKFPRGLQVCGFVQIALGVVGILGAALLWRGAWVGKLVLLLAIIGVLINTGIYATIMIRSH